MRTMSVNYKICSDREEVIILGKRSTDAINGVLSLYAVVRFY